jgi:putative ABC transport system permease protein
MSFPDLIVLALRGLQRRPVRTLLTVLGIVVAVASMVIFLSLGEGFRSALSREIGNVGPDLQIQMAGSDGATFGGSVPEVPIEVVDRLKPLQDELGIKKLFPITLTVRGSLSGDGYLIEGYPVDQINVTDIYGNLKLKEGRWLTAADKGQLVAVVGAQAAQRGKLTLGKDVRFNRESLFKVVGILEKAGGFTDSFIFVPLDRISSAMGIEGKVTTVVATLEDASTARKAADTINTRFPELNAQTQGDVLSILDKAIAIGDAFRLGISAIALIVGGLAVANTVMMGVYERTREFGVIRAIGAKPSFIFQLVVFESLLLALLGGIGGVIVGYLGTLVVNFVVRDLISVAIAVVTPRLTLFAMLVAAGLGLLSGLLPARTASRLVITQALGRN